MRHRVCKWFEDAYVRDTDARDTLNWRQAPGCDWHGSCLLHQSESLAMSSTCHELLTHKTCGSNLWQTVYADVA